MKRPHEWVFVFYVGVLWLWLVVVAGPLDADALVYGAVLAGVLATLRWCPDRWWRLRLAVFPVAMNVCFVAMKTAVPKIRAGRFDDVLRAIDAGLLGRTPALSLESIATPVVTEVMSFCYALFFPMLTIAFVIYLCSRREMAQPFYTGLFTLYGIGFLGYALVPAAGPYLAMAGEFRAPLEGFWITRLNSAIVKAGSNGVDVFPSLHCAVSAYILFFDRTHRRWRFWIYVVPCVGLWLATLYLRYHYFVDVVCGFALAALALRVASRNERCATS